MMDMELAGKDCKDDKYGQKGKYYDHDISHAARTIVEAEEIKNDPEKMKYVSKCVKADLATAKKAVSSIQDIRDISNQGDSDEEEDS